jgi:hypothetical protein
LTTAVVTVLGAPKLTTALVTVLVLVDWGGLSCRKKLGVVPTAAARASELTVTVNERTKRMTISLASGTGMVKEQTARNCAAGIP